MNKYGFYYFSGYTNKEDNIIFCEFSTLHNGKGDSFELVLKYQNNDLKYHRNGHLKEEIKGLTDSNLIQLITELLSFNE
jgi:hypothetical protein